MEVRMRKGICFLALGSLLALMGGTALASTSTPASTDRNGSRYTVTDLVSDQPGHAMNTDPNLVNAWGLVAGPTTPWWVSDNGTDLSTLYDGDGNIIPLVVDVKSAPTGTVYNGGPHFVVSDGKGHSGPSVFLFSTEDGTILGWNPNVPPGSTTAFVVADRSDVDAIYKGLAIGHTKAGDFIYATDFHNDRVDVFDGDFNLVTLKGSFKDPDIPHGYAPFGIQNIDNTLFVTYAKQDADAEDDVPGRGHGFIDAFTPGGLLIGRVASRGLLNSPWGLAWAPDDFGKFSGDLLVGNFGNGKINAYREHGENEFRNAGMLKSMDGSALEIEGLWALEFGNGGAAGPTNALYFTAGPDDESHGLFGRIDAMAR
jgi:uncharacterized protein (TIGR03118 family)